jgi:N-carbamoylputrescine amidase
LRGSPIKTTAHRMNAPEEPQEATRVALIQMRCNRSTADNLARSVELIRQAAADGAKIVCLPELFLTEYFCQQENHAHFQRAEPVDGPTSRTLARLASELELVLLVSIFEHRTAGIYHNTCLVIDADGTILGHYRKMHIPDDPQYYEKFYFTPGDLGFRAFDTRHGCIGVLICWDQWFPEAARLTAMRGAQVLFYPTAIGWFPNEKEACGEAQHDSWLTIQRSHAIANGCFVAVVNRVGFERQPGGDASQGIEFWGQSFICNPQGQLLVAGSTGGEEVVIAEVDFAEVDRTRTAWPFLRDRRIDAYDGLRNRFLDAE